MEHGLSKHGGQRGERTRQEIVAAAHQLFLKQGFHGTSMRAIAQAADLAVGGIYNHFPNKEAIFAEVLQANHPIHSMLPALQSAQGETTEAFVRDAAQHMVASFGERTDLLNLFFIEMVEFSGCHLPSLFQANFPQALSLAERFMQNRAELRPIPPPVLVRAFVGLFFSFVMTGLMAGPQKTPQFQSGDLDHFVEIFLHGILVE
jgi:AcrR family transcriptional regulator